MTPKRKAQKKTTKRSTEMEAYGGDGYSVGTWMGKPKYVCDHCSYDSLHEEVIKRHVAGHGSMPAAAALAPRLPEPPADEEE